MAMVPPTSLAPVLVTASVLVALRPWRRASRSAADVVGVVGTSWGEGRRLRGLAARRQAPRPSPAVTLGSALAHLAGRTVSLETAAWLGRGFVIGGIATVVSPVLGLLAVAGVVGAAVLSQRAVRRRRHDAVLSALPEVIDLFGVAIAAGLPVPGAIGAVSERSPPPIRQPLREAARRMARGQSTAEALDTVESRLGPAVSPLIAALTTGDRMGTPLRDTLAELGTQARLDRRRRAEEAARRLPVTLLFPLVCCTLPAFGLLTVVPLIVGSLRALRL